MAARVELGAMKHRVALRCATCGGLLGHLVAGEWIFESNDRHTIDSVRFVPMRAAAEEVTLCACIKL